MKIYDSINDFLEHKKIETEFYESSSVIYYGKLSVFSEFLELEGLNDLNCESTLRGLSHNKIIESLVYYVDSRNIGSKHSARGFITTIREYFSYLLLHQNIKNSVFASVEDGIELNKLVEECIKDKNLKESEVKKQPVSETMFVKLNKFCNEILDSTTIEDIQSFEKTNSEPYTLFVSALMTKTVMFLGVKPELVSSFRVSSLDLGTNKIFINGYRIHLPDKLGVQMKKYTMFLDELSIKNSSQLFVNREGIPYHKEYTTMFKAIKKVMGNGSAESIAKFTIIQMIKEGINPSIILNLTNFGMNTYLDCQDLVNTEKMDYEKTRHLDSKIRKMPIFDIL